MNDDHGSGCGSVIRMLKDRSESRSCPDFIATFNIFYSSSSMRGFFKLEPACSGFRDALPPEKGDNAMSQRGAHIGIVGNTMTGTGVILFRDDLNPGSQCM